MEHKQRILIVDDRAENLFTLRNVLKEIESDIEIIEAANGNDALIASLNYDFALVILDVQMPGIDGYEVAEFIRNEPKTRFLPIVFLSAIFSDDFHVFKGYRAGGVDFMTKPFKPEILLSKVRVFLDLDRQRSEVKQRNAELEQALETVNSLNISLQTQTKALDQSAAVSIINREGLIIYANDFVLPFGRLFFIGNKRFRFPVVEQGNVFRAFFLACGCPSFFRENVAGRNSVQI